MPHSTPPRRRTALPPNPSSEKTASAHIFADSGHWDCLGDAELPTFDATETAALAKLSHMLEDQQGAQIFTAEEVATLRDMIVAWRGLAALGAIGGLIRPLAWIVGIALALFLALKGKLEPLTHILWG